MKKMTTLAALFATAALVAPMASTAAGHAAAAPKAVDNWRGTDGTPWRNGTGQLCWRDAFWTPATAAPGCDGEVKPAPAPAPAPAAKPPAPAPAAPVSEKVTYASDAFFDFDKAVVKKEAKAKLDDLVSKTGAIALEVIIAVGHTDSVGADAYNQKLSVRRAEAVKAYLTGKGIEANRIYTEGKGEKSPVADNKTREGKAKNRRTEIEVVGTRTVQPKK